jgi:RimJ/RimL family protein N-acetyltransferase
VSLSVREMRVDEIDLVVEYFHGSTDEHLVTLGVDRTKLPEPATFRQLLGREFDRPAPERDRLLVIWESDDGPVGFSSCDSIAIGEQAKMHLHVTAAANRRQGIGTECVRQTVRIYFDRFGLQRLFAEPNAYNTAPNRTLQRVGFRFVLTHITVPGWINFEQPVTRWVFERSQLAGLGGKTDDRH